MQVLDVQELELEQQQQVLQQQVLQLLAEKSVDPFVGNLLSANQRTTNQR